MPTDTVVAFNQLDENTVERGDIMAILMPIMFSQIIVYLTNLIQKRDFKRRDLKRRNFKKTITKGPALSNAYETLRLDHVHDRLGE
ncbi:MAG: hypothetical protein AAGC93_16020 [Cyanobacteria bacterium P01_F01_bin.53]